MGRISAKPTLADVANRAGVSQSSASRALNRVQPLSKELREKVFAAAREVGYTVSDDSVMSRGPICAIIPDIANPYFSEVIAGIQDAAEREGAVVSVFLVSEVARNRGFDLDRWASHGRCSGLIITSSTRTVDDESVLKFFRKFGVPVVSINRTIEDETIPSIHINYIDSMYRATRHLLTLGHERIAILSGPETPDRKLMSDGNEVLYEEAGRLKVQGVEKALKEMGIDSSQVFWRSGAATTTEGGYQLMNRLLDHPTHVRPTAVVAFSDVLAIGALHAIQSRFLRVPEDISIVGFDDIAMAAHTNPPLTTISTPKFEMGRLAAELILHRRTNPDTAAERYLMMESPLIVRETTAVYSPPTAS